jgi:hypothetical protein
MSKNTIKIDELFKLLSDVASDSKFEIIQTLKEPFISNPNALIWLTELTSGISANQSKIEELFKTEIEKNPVFAKSLEELIKKLKAEKEAKEKAKKEEEAKKLNEESAEEEKTNEDL